MKNIPLGKIGIYLYIYIYIYIDFDTSPHMWAHTPLNMCGLKHGIFNI